MSPYHKINGEYYKKSAVARLYFQFKGEKLSNIEAWNRWKMVRKPDKDILAKVIDYIYAEQKKAL